MPKFLCITCCKSVAKKHKAIYCYLCFLNNSRKKINFLTKTKKQVTNEEKLIN